MGLNLSLVSARNISILFPDSDSQTSQLFLFYFVEDSYNWTGGESDGWTSQSRVSAKGAKCTLAILTGKTKTKKSKECGSNLNLKED